MGLLSDFFIADGLSVPKYQGGEAFGAADKCQFKGLTPLQGAQFLAVLRGQEYTVDTVSEFKLLTPEDAEAWTTSVPQDMVNALATLQAKEIPTLAAKFAQATAEDLGWSTQDFVPIVTELSALAGRAVAQSKKMYLWNSL